MTFQEIFNEPGLYADDTLILKGRCLKVDNNGFLRLISYDSKDSINYTEVNMPVHKDLFNRDYRKVFTRQSLFK
jgi:hypothetical protein